MIDDSVISGLFMGLYGLIFLSSCFMLPAWAAIGRTARSEGDRDYAWVADALALNSIGSLIFFGSRLGYGFISGRWVLIGGWFAGMLIVAAVFLEASKVMLMMVRRRHGRMGVWRAFVLASVVWAAFAIVWTFGRVL